MSDRLITSVLFLKSGNAKVILTGPRGQKVTINAEPKYAAQEIPKVAAMWGIELSRPDSWILAQLDAARKGTNDA